MNIAFIKNDLKYGRIKISFFVSLLFAAFYMLVFYKTQNYSNFRALSYVIAFSILLILDVVLTISFYFLKKTTNSFLYRAGFIVTAVFLGVMFFVSSDWLFRINLFTDTNIYKKILIGVQFLPLVTASFFIYLPEFKKKGRNCAEKKISHTSFLKKDKAILDKDILFITALLYFCFLIFIFSPVQLYASAPGEIEADISRLLIINIGIAIVITGVFSFAFIKVKGFYKQTILNIIVYISFCAFFYSFILNISYGALDNYILTNSAVLYRGFLKNIIEISSLIIFAFFTIHIVNNKAALVKNVFFLLLVVGIIQSGVSLLGIKGYDEKKTISVSSEKMLPEYNKELMGYSRNGKNIVVLLLDMFSGGYFPEIMKDLPELEETLSGFTWYPNTLSAGYNTSSSVPGMYAGWSYIPSAINEKEYKGYIVDQIIESYEVLPEILSHYNYKTSYTDPDYYRTPHGNIEELEKRGIIAGFNHHYLPFWKNKNREYVDENHTEEKNQQKTAVKAAKYLFAVSLFKASPLILKPIIYREGDWIFIGSGEIKNNAYNFALRSWAFMDLLDEVSNTDAGTNTFKYFHNYITHGPFAMSSDGQPVMNYPDPEAGDNIHGKNAYYSAKSAMMAVSDWVNWLKKNDIYDNTKLIIVADHGNDVTENPMMKDGFKVEGLTEREFNRAQILLLVKDFYSEGKLKTDSRFMSNADVPAIILSSLCDCSSENKITNGCHNNSKKALIYDGSFFPENPFFEKPFPADPTKGDPVSRILRTVKSDSWRWEYISKNRKFEFKWVYDVKDSLFDADNWTKVE